jgi:nucleotidyltransferase/DNA polymerase involved in DNA repair
MLQWLQCQELVLNTLQWLSCPELVLRIRYNDYHVPELVLRIRYNGYHVQNQVHKYAPVVSALKIRFNNATLRDISRSYKKGTLYETHRADSTLQDVHACQGFKPGGT